MSKLRSYRFNPVIISCVENYLRDRSQYVEINEEQSQWQPVTSGIPQGSVLGPLLFLIYINDLPKHVNSTIYMYADDTKIYREIREKHDQEILQKDLDSLKAWSDEWFLKFHPKKCYSITIGKEEDNDYTYYIKFADPILALLLSICFTCMFKHSYLPVSMLDSVVVPLVKNKNGDLSDKNNYRPIALSSTISKVFENIILHRLEEYLWTTDNQFGFKSGHSTDLCVYALTEFIEYLKRRSTSVYVAFLDASKAFDKINHWVLFKKLLNRGVPIYLVKVLCYWYQHQSMYVKWGSTLSSKFQVTNGVRQGGVLSPLLFNVYVNELSELLNKSGIGGNMGGIIINHMLYADDICIVSLSSSGLQQLLNICISSYHC